MRGQRKIPILIYHNGIEYTFLANDKSHYLRIKTFLNSLTDRSYRSSQLPRPIPDPGQDFYILDAVQAQKFNEYMKQKADA
jgi:hypothetical protein